MEKQLSYIRLLTKNYRETFNFYKETLGLQLKFGGPEDVYCEFETGNTDIALFDQKEMEKALNQDLGDRTEYNSNIVIIFPVKDVDKEYERLKGLGVEFLTEPSTKEEWHVRVVHTKDPEGNIVEINTRIELLDN